jgi:hypothetical protein
MLPVANFGLAAVTGIGERLLACRPIQVILQLQRAAYRSLMRRRFTLISTSLRSSDSGSVKLHQLAN